MNRVGNAPCSWGVIENIEGERYDYARVLDEMAATGYACTELGDWGFMPTDPAQLTRELAWRDLQLVGSWVNNWLHDAARLAEDVETCVRTAGLLAAVGGPECFIVLGNNPYGDPLRSLNSGRITPAMSMNDAQFADFARGAEEVARQVREETGLRTVVHPHIGTWIETPEETERLLAMTDPELLGIVFDTGHWRFGGGDPVADLRRFADRVWYVHFKDHDPQVAQRSREQGWDGPRSVGEGVFPELGQGDVDFPAVLRVLDEIGYHSWILVEQDVLPGLGTPKESARRNREYLAGIGL